ncbi:hypothetical protein IAT38_006461 [Cryptococcus sp. DSM 104549]
MSADAPKPSTSPTPPTTLKPGLMTPRAPSPSNVPSSVSPGQNGHGHDAHEDGHTHGHGHAHSHSPSEASGQLKNAGEGLAAMADMEAKCGGCKNVIDQENGGVVVAFGQSLWHVECFRCAKCKEKVSADTNLLLLSDGSPVCGNCSYQCFICKQAITEEAIMTGDESYHAHCFTCRTCKRRIDELIFAKTSQGIYCMNCHNERVARSRRHAEAKRQRQARKEEKERERREKEEARAREEEGRQGAGSPLPAGNYLGLNHVGGSSQALNEFPSPHPTGTPRIGGAESGYALNDAFEDAEREAAGAGQKRDLGVEQPVQRAVSPAGRQLAEAQNLPLPSSPSEVPPTARSPSPYGKPQPPTPLPHPQPSQSPHAHAFEAERSPQHRPSHSQSHAMGLNVPSTSKAERRRSINPGMTFNMDSQNNTFSADPRGAHPPSPLRASFDAQGQAQRPGSANGVGQTRPLRSPTSPSPAGTPTNERFPFKDGAGSGGQLQQAQAQARLLQQQQQHQPPPRTSSLDQLSNRTRLVPPRVEEEGVPRSSGETFGGLAPALPGKQGSGSGGQLGDGAGGGGAQGAKRTPRLNAPDLPPMSFSLSDPDFAVILNNMDEQPESGGSGGEQSAATMSRMSVGSAATIRPVIDIPAEDDSAPSSPMGGTSPSLARSPTMDALAAESDPPSRSSSRSRLSPNDPPPYHPGHPHPGLARRQASADSAISVRSKFGNGSFERIVEVVAEAEHKREENVTLGVAVLRGFMKEFEELNEKFGRLDSKYTGAKRTSQQYSEGLTVAGEEYDKEVRHRQELEAEVSRLRAQLHSQTARISVISGDERRAEHMKRRSKDLASSLSGLERDISRLRAQRDIALVEVDELHERKKDGKDALANGVDAGQSLASRLDTIKHQYSEELEPLAAQVQELQRQIHDLREIKEQTLEESAALTAKNEDLAELHSQLTRQTEALQDTISRARPPTIFGKNGVTPRVQLQQSPSMASLVSHQGLQDVPEETVTARVVKVNKPEPIEQAPVRKFKWYKSSKGPDASSLNASISKPLAFQADKGRGGGMNLAVAGLGMGGMGGAPQRPGTEMGMKDHTWQQHTMMRRFARCELCQEKMWGIQELKCSSCGIVCHHKCSDKLPRTCLGKKVRKDEPEEPLPPTMFGKPLPEQVAADNTVVPVIVTKCIDAVEAVGMEYEGIYRKTGGSSQCKQITELFERGDYDAFDLTDMDTFNDISAVTSVLKTYFRQLPNPLLTHALHESFVTAATIRDTTNKRSAVCALLAELPKDHWHTLKALMLHLNRVTAQSGINLMTSQNLGVVFGPTLMRSADPNREFGDMAGKALSVQWLVDNAPQVFAGDRE